MYMSIRKTPQITKWSSWSRSVPISVQIHKQICLKRALELQVHFCMKINPNSYTNLSQTGYGAPGPDLYQFQYKFISKSV